jgi:hypothetical protein
MKTRIFLVLAAAALIFISACATGKIGVGVGGGAYYEDDYGR